MSVISKYVCDRCGKEIPYGHNMTKVSLDNEVYTTYDLCENCADTIMTPLGILISGRYTPCRYCQPEYYGGVTEPILNGEVDYASIEPESGQMYVVSFEGECDDPIAHEVYVNIRRCPMCGRKL